MASTTYVHGYSSTEAARLADQADTLAELLHHDTRYPDGAKVLEAGCGVGAQTAHLLAHSPGAHFTCVDREASSLAAASATIGAPKGIDGKPRVIFQQADLFEPPFPDGAFDHLFVCFVLEHVPAPARLLGRLRRLVRPGGTVTVIEGDHGSTFFHPDGPKARKTIACLVQAQAHGGGDANIGRRLYPLMLEAGFAAPHVSPRFVYADASRPRWVDGFTRKTFIAMVEGARETSLRLGLIDAEEWDEGIAELNRAALSDGTFCYTFFKAVAVVE